MSVKGYLLLLGLLVAGLVWAEAARPRPLDLRVRLERQGRAPFDAEVFSESLPDWLGQPVEPVEVPPFDRLADSAVTGRTYLFLADAFDPDPAETARLLRFAARGNAVFVAAHQIGGALGDSLGQADSLGYYDGLRTELTTDDLLPDDLSFDGSADGGALAPDTLRLEAPGVAGAYPFPVRVSRWHLVGLDSARTRVLGTTGQRRRPTLARVRVGRGEVWVSSTPLAFSNAALTGGGAAAAYVGAVLAALPDQPVWWDDHHKPYASYAHTPLRYVLATPALRWAYGLLVVAGLLFLAFRARRWQRAIPVVAPPPNAQREFARTVGRLHFVHRNASASRLGGNARLAERMAGHVLDRLRSDLRLSDPDLGPETARRAAVRAGVPEDEAQALFATLARLRAERRPDAGALVRLDAEIARFFRHTDASPVDAPPVG